jgi:hypothetical protein
MATCKACDAEIIWLKTKNGKRMPVDAAPSSTGNCRIVGGTVEVLGPRAVEEHTGSDLHHSHYTTCTDPRRFRRA